jgi:hypothetical protein
MVPTGVPPSPTSAVKHASARNKYPAHAPEVAWFQHAVYAFEEA